MNDELKRNFIRHTVLKISTIGWIQKIKQDFAVFKSQGYKMMILSEFKITSELKNEKVTIYLRLVGLVFIFLLVLF
jgi:hypothetical protein